MTTRDTISHAEQLWTAADGTVCLLATFDSPPMYAVTLVRDDKILRERRLYGDASARMLALSWNQCERTE